MTLFQPDSNDVAQQAEEYCLQGKKKVAAAKRRASEESQLSGKEHSSDEDARDREITFLMSVGEKRAYEIKKKREKEYNEKFKEIFVKVVACHAVNRAQMMNVIDMTNQKAFKGGSPDKKPQKIMNDKVFSMINVESKDLNKIEDSSFIIP